MSLTYILIDFENVQPEAADLRLIRGPDYRVRLFHGPHQNRIDMGIAKALQPLGSQVEFIQSERSGKNALDFHIAFGLGQLVGGSVTSPTPSRFVIVSKDGDFDVLIDHVVSLGHDAIRVPSVRDALSAGTASEVALPVTESDKVQLKKKSSSKPETILKKPLAASPVKKPAKAASPSPDAVKEDPYRRAVDYLRDHPRNRPATLQKLEVHFTTALGKGTTAQLVKAIIDRLQSDGIVVVVGTKVEYKL
jgi:hypothetical protein